MSHIITQQSPQSLPVVAIIGATGAVGVELIRCLERRRFPLSQLRLFASARSAGQHMTYAGQALVVEELREDALAGIDVALFSAGGSISKRFAPLLVEQGAVVIDNSSAFRMRDDVPLIVPEINGHLLEQPHRLIANPNCATIIALTPLWPIHQRNPIRRLTLATYQAASGAGAVAMQELEASTRAYLVGETYAPRVLPHPYAFNVFSHNSPIHLDTGYNDEETKIMQEAPKIFGDAELRVSATCVRVPVLRAHSIAITFECEHPLSAAHVRAAIEEAPGVRCVDDPERNYFPMPRDASGRDEILVGRIRADRSCRTGRSVSLFVSGDQLLKGAALNAVQIAEIVVSRRPKLD